MRARRVVHWLPLDSISASRWLDDVCCGAGGGGPSPIIAHAPAHPTRAHAQPRATATVPRRADIRARMRGEVTTPNQECCHAANVGSVWWGCVRATRMSPHNHRIEWRRDGPRAARSSSRGELFPYGTAVTTRWYCRCVTWCAPCGERASAMSDRCLQCLRFHL